LEHTEAVAPVPASPSLRSFSSKEVSMYKYKRRILLRSISTAAVATVAGIPLSLFGALQKVDPKDPQAVSLGYTDDTKTVDNKKFPKHDPSQRCDNCQFYVKAQESGNLAPCTIFGGKAVSAQGWCSAWAKKTA
jgi:hypothetical protein